MQQGTQTGKPSVLALRKRKAALKILQRCLGTLSSHTVFVEGQRDRAALQRLGCSPRQVYTISGNLAISCRQVAAQGTDEVVVLTDFDRRGNEQLERACDELEGHSIRCNREVRRTLGKLLRIRYIEQIDRIWTEFLKQTGG